MLGPRDADHDGMSQTQRIAGFVVAVIAINLLLRVIPFPDVDLSSIPFPDFPDFPDWFNEGLASLYEQCSLNGEEIRGLENWRLPALQEAIRDERLRPLGELIEDQKFYDDELVGMNYAQARYLLFYLQEKRLLKDFYKRFRDGVGEDATGLKTLKNVIAPQEMDAFEAEWRKWVLGLRFE